MNVIIAFVSPVPITRNVEVLIKALEIGERYVGANGAVASTVIVIPVAAPVLPATSVTNQVNVYVPSINVKVIVQNQVTEIVQVTPLNVIIVPDSPVPVALTVPVVKIEPEAGVRIVGARGATVSIVIVTPEIAQVFQAASVTLPVNIRTPSANE